MHTCFVYLCAPQVGGSARFVRNCACWLSTNLLSQPEPEPPTPESVQALCMDGAFEGECSITFERGPLALLATRLADPEMNTVSACTLTSTDSDLSQVEP